MNTELLKLTWVDQKTAEYMLAAYKDQPASRWAAPNIGVYIGAYFINDFLLRRVIYYFWKEITSQSFVVVAVVSGTLTSKSGAPKDIAKKILEDYLGMAIILLVLLLPFLAIAFLGDVFICIPWLLYNITRARSFYNNKNKDYIDNELRCVQELKEAKFLAHSSTFKP